MPAPIHAGARYTAVLVCVTMLVVFGISGCSGGQDDAKPPGSIVERAPPLKDVLITSAQRRGFPPDTVQRRFFSFWSALQFQALDEVASSFHPVLLDDINMERLGAAIRFQAAYLRSVKPSIESVEQRSENATVYYVVKDLSGKQTPRSISFDRVNGSWKIVHDSSLDDALRDSVQNATQLAIDPLAERPSKRAVVAGYEASILQSAFLDRRRSNSAGTARKNEGRAP